VLTDDEIRLIGYYNRTLRYYSPLQKITVQQLAALVGTSIVGPVLDIGCGDGRLAGHLDPRTDYVGVDYAHRRVQAARAAFPQRTFVCSDANTVLTDTNRLWGTTVLVEVLEHVAAPDVLAAAAAAKSLQVLATAPVNMPDQAHLWVWETERQMRSHLNPDRVARWQSHWVLAWGDPQNGPA
jgi:2-polyprenyl-3-methyl-5-hydroxy-6-metoxy-1,4-benzoquinol methylase